jgi:CheY-like chemotaxis protein
MENKFRILIVEDDAITTELLQDKLELNGYAVVSAVTNGDDAIYALIEKRPQLVLMDIHIKGNFDGIDLTAIINERFHVPVIYLSAFADESTLERARMTESSGYIIKPVTDRELFSKIDAVMNMCKSTRDSGGTPADGDSSSGIGRRDD